MMKGGWKINREGDHYNYDDKNLIWWSEWCRVLQYGYQWMSRTVLVHYFLCNGHALVANLYCQLEDAAFGGFSSDPCLYRLLFLLWTERRWCKCCTLESKYKSIVGQLQNENVSLINIFSDIFARYLNFYSS